MRSPFIAYISCLSVLLASGCQSIDPQQQHREKARQLIIGALKDINKNDFKSAATHLQRATVENPQEPESFLLLGQLFLQAGQYEQARDLMENAATLFPKNASIFYLLGIAERSMGEKDKAMACIQYSAKLFGGKYQYGEEIYRNAAFMALVFAQHLQ